MTKISQFKQYVAECIQILCWVYFKPYTFQRQLQDIHPRLTPTISFFVLRNDLPSHPHLKRFFHQVWWIIGVAPLFFFILAAFPYAVFTKNILQWLFGGFFLFGWLIGILLTQSIVTGTHIKSLIGVLVVVTIIHLLSILFVSESSLAFLISVAAGVIIGVTIGIVAAVFGCASISITVGASVCMIVSVAYGAAYGVAVAMSVSFACVSFYGGAFSMQINIDDDSAVIMTLNVVLGLGLTLFLGIAIGIVFDRVIDVVFGVEIAFGVAFGITWVLGLLRVYFWLPEVLWMLALLLISRQGYQAQCLRYLPPHFDESTILPLPFMARLITNAYWQNPALARSTIDYLINSTNQQKVATKAMIGIAADTLNQVQTTTDIVATKEQLAWLPSPPPKELGTFLPQFVEISQDVGVYLEATSAYRQYELLNPPIKSLKQLNNSLALNRNAQQATTFGSIAQRWLNILIAAQQTLQAEAERSAEIPQVYIAGNGLDPETAKSRFKGRKDIFREIETLSLSSPPPVLLFNGGRRTGKTSSLKYLPQKLVSEIIPLLIDLQGGALAQTLPGLAEYLVKEIINAARQARNLQLPYPNQEKLFREPFLTLQDWFTTIETTAPNKRFLLCLDEFERLSEFVDTTGSRIPLNFFRHILQHRRQWILLFSGSHTLEELAPYWSDYLINTRTIRLTYLQESEARELVEKPIPDFLNIYQPTAVTEIINQTRCQPYLVQLLCSVIVDHLNNQQRKLATRKDVHNCIPVAIETGSQYFRELWTTLAEKDQDVLLRLIEGEAVNPRDKLSLRRLVNKEILEKKADSYQFQVPLVKRYIEQLFEF